MILLRYTLFLMDFIKVFGVKYRYIIWLNSASNFIFTFVIFIFYVIKNFKVYVTVKKFEDTVVKQA